MRGIPGYQGIVDDLEHRISTGQYKPGEKLPTLRALRERYRVSYGTMQVALAILRDRGAIYGQQGVGIYVREPEDHR